jgi:hypothetical protein
MVDGRMKIVILEGDRDHLINRGALCSKATLSPDHDDRAAAAA